MPISHRPLLRTVSQIVPLITIVALLVSPVGCGKNQSSPADTNSGIKIIDDAQFGPSSPSLKVIQPTATPILEPTPQSKFNPDPVILPTVVPNFTPTPIEDEQESLASRMDSINLKTNVFRSLNSIRGIDIELISRDEMQSRILSDFERRKDDTLITESLYRALGILSQNDNLYEIQLSLLDYSASSFYDTSNDTLYIASENLVSTPSQIRTYVHEFVHGLQAQHFDIKSITKNLAGNIDARIALHALVEGDATISELVFIDKDMSEEEREASSAVPGDELLSALREAPRVIQREFLFPLEEGARFVNYMYGAGGFETINEAYANPPLSTAQILHPERYEAGQSPIEVSVTDPSSVLGDAWSVYLENTLGEFLLQAYLEAIIGPELAVTATEGWGGDTVLLLDGPENESAMILRAVWDTESDAAEFVNAFAQFTHARAGGTWEILEKENPSLLLRLPKQVVLLTIALNTTVAIFAPDEDVLNSINAVVQ
ncbi:hypothetical protein M1O55_01190 [Dehalococcoidia bacterium]|nr:hypothetical protein [Dehalococcoidia bacterium]